MDEHVGPTVWLGGGNECRLGGTAAGLWRNGRRRFAGRLLAWFRLHARDLPWRRTRDPYAVWVSEIMLQQTQVATVVPYFERFLQRFPTVQSLAEADEQDVLRLWEGSFTEPPGR